MREEFVSVLTRRFNGDGHGRVFSDETGVRFEVESAKGAEPLAISQMRHGKWVAYAARALVVRFWDLAKVRSITLQLPITHPPHRKPIPSTSYSSSQGTF